MGEDTTIVYTRLKDVPCAEGEKLERVGPIGEEAPTRLKFGGQWTDETRPGLFSSPSSVKAYNCANCDGYLLGGPERRDFDEIHPQSHEPRKFDKPGDKGVKYYCESCGKVLGKDITERFRH